MSSSNRYQELFVLTWASYKEHYMEQYPGSSLHLEYYSICLSHILLLDHRNQDERLRLILLNTCLLHSTHVRVLSFRYFGLGFVCSVTSESISGPADENMILFGNDGWTAATYGVKEMLMNDCLDHYIAARWRIEAHMKLDWQQLIP